MVNMHYGALKIIMTDRISTTFGSMGDTNPFTSNNTSGGAGTGTSGPGGDNYERPVKRGEEAECRCRIPCPVCGGCTDETVPEGCEPCSCPEAPQKVDLCSSGQNGLYKIIEWYKYICELFGINSDINVRTDNIADVNNCLKTGGTAGAYKNGYGSVMGVTVRWQVSYAGYPDTDQNLSFSTTNEPGYYRAILTQGGVMGAPGITLVFEEEEERDRVIGSIPCLN
jgi:hypothetical protein